MARAVYQTLASREGAGSGILQLLAHPKSTKLMISEGIRDLSSQKNLKIPEIPLQ
jgi:hypothetical protein